MHRTTLVAVLALASPLAGAGTIYSSDFTHLAGTGLAPGGAGGTLDSLHWSVSGLSGGDSGPGEEHLGGDHGRGLSSGGVGTGGLYAFEIPGSRSGRAPGVQSTASDFTPGAMVLTLENLLPGVVEALELAFDLLVYNDGARATGIAVDLGVAGAWSPLPSLAWTTPQASDDDPIWSFTTLTATRSDLAIAPGDALSLRWRFDEAGGSGSRDEIAIDRIEVFGHEAAPGPGGAGGPGPDPGPGPGPSPVPAPDTLPLLGAGLLATPLVRLRRLVRRLRRR